MIMRRARGPTSPPSLFRLRPRRCCRVRACGALNSLALLPAWPLPRRVHGASSLLDELASHGAVAAGDQMQALLGEVRAVLHSAAFKLALGDVLSRAYDAVGSELDAIMETVDAAPAAPRTNVRAMPLAKLPNLLILVPRPLGRPSSHSPTNASPPGHLIVPCPCLLFALQPPS